MQLTYIYICIIHSKKCVANCKFLMDFSYTSFFNYFISLYSLIQLSQSLPPTSPFQTALPLFLQHTITNLINRGVFQRYAKMQNIPCSPPFEKRKHEINSLLQMTSQKIYNTIRSASLSDLLRSDAAMV